jgi:phage baseplate assembly protein W
MATLKKLYSDIDFTFTRKPGTNDVAISYDEMAVIRSVRNLLLTNNYERPFNPELGSNINTILFEPMSPITAEALRLEIENTVKNYEPRASLKNVEVSVTPDQNAYTASLEFYIENATLPTTVTLLLERNR